MVSHYSATKSLSTSLNCLINNYNALKMFNFIKQKCKTFYISTNRVNSLKKFVLLILISSSILNSATGASLHHKDYRSAGLFALNNFTDLYDASSSASSSSSSIKTMDLTSVELNSIDVGDFDPAAASRNLQLGTKENTGTAPYYIAISSANPIILASSGIRALAPGYT
ncbi:hypothetical protein CVS40_10724 [Lucilia cuprina]|nr:hypothetical protein CVS40_10724 [Lucilia cuprina]